MNTSHPILTAEQAAAHEQALLGGSEERAWQAMSLAGVRLAEACLRDFQELGPFPARARVLVLAGRGHNGGDALLAARELLLQKPEASIAVVFVHGERALRPLAARAWRLLGELAGGRVEVLAPEAAPVSSWELCLDGIYGFRFRPPMDPAATQVLCWAAGQRVRMRVAVDMPSGLDEKHAFRADFTYATGILKSSLLSCANAGRVRYLDLGFFEAGPGGAAGGNWALVPSVLDALRDFRPARSDKRSFGHVYILAGSRHYPGAALLCVLGALRSGAGLVTAFVPESLVPSFAARAPEAMWVGMPETPEGGIALEGRYLVEQRLSRASSLVVGPGLGREAETLALVEALATVSPASLVIDADALQPSIVKAGWVPRILTPHAGEFLRLAGGVEPEKFSAETTAVLVVKGPLTRVVWEGRSHYSFSGGPVLARGGSGDLLAGLAGGLLAQVPGDPLVSAQRAVLWQGRAADLMARRQGQTAVSTTDILQYLPEALHDGGDAS